MTTPYPRWGLAKDLQGVGKDGLGRESLNLQISPIVLVTVVNTVLRCSLKFN